MVKTVKAAGASSHIRLACAPYHCSKSAYVYATASAAIRHSGNDMAVADHGSGKLKQLLYADIQACSHTDRETDRQTDRETDRQTRLLAAKLGKSRQVQASLRKWAYIHV